ncbi:hypothetical protein [Actinotalea sp.]|mgnify:CR=1 FL=1|uniref:hypothetical protein n=1 Tax=Actinotalea sp. TaxID=1872145 RepID=UPI002CA39738|nr:hypothetical protein [Actinotalea sp.]HQY33623.1 hypothetical protein [Actinotalea sp.]HRA50180.1 hypothetical protein [Actinotalea sp.]
MHPALQALAALVPSVGVGLLFWLAIRTIVRADRTERAAMARLDAEERRDAVQKNVPPGPAVDD